MRIYEEEHPDRRFCRRLPNRGDVLTLDQFPEVHGQIHGQARRTHTGTQAVGKIKQGGHLPPNYAKMFDVVKKYI